MSAYVTLVKTLPKGGFTYRNLGGTAVTPSMSHDLDIQRAIRASGVRFSRPIVTHLLVVVFETLAVTLHAVYVPRSDDIGAMTAVYEAIDVTYRATEWAANLQPSIFHQLVLGIRAARRISLKESGRDGAVPGSWAGKLARAVDAFDHALAKRGWSGANELRALEGETKEGDEEKIRLARGNVSDGYEGILCDGMEGMGLRWVEENDDYDAEIVTDGKQGTCADVQMKDDGKALETSFEPYLGRD